MSDSSEAARTAEDLPLPGGDFRMFLTRLGIQGLMSLGVIENPLTGESSTNVAQARMIVDDLRMLRDKTSGNLEDDESSALAKLLGDLESHLVRIESDAAGE